MAKIKKTLSQAIEDRRATPSFDGTPIPPEDLKQILDAGLHAPSGFNMQPWRFIVVQSPEQKRRLRAASYNQAKVEEASAVVVACGDADGWRKDLDLMLQLGREGGMPESYAAQARTSVSNFSFGLQHRRDACVVEQACDDRLHAHDADGRGDGLRYRSHGGL